MKQWSSLRGKITFGYYVVGTLIVALAVFAFLELRLIKEKVLSGERISEFFDTTLEIRRFEKNYFLYHQPVDYDENVAYTVAARALLAQHAPEFAAIIPAKRVDALREELDLYVRLMAEYTESKKENEALSQRIRRSGKEIVTIAEEIARAERRTLQSLLDRHRLNLMVSIVVLMLLIVALGRLLSNSVVRPLKEVEDSMEAVARGRLAKITMSARDREIASLTTAFNHVLHELELRQKHLVRSEKLASLGTMLSGVAHELNNPLSNISTSCQILLEEIDEGDVAYKKELLTQIDEQTVRARNIVRSLLDFAREREFKREPINLAQLVGETLRFLKGQIPRETSIVQDIPPNLSLHADRQRLQQVLFNLVKNGIEAVEGGGELRIAARSHAAADAEIDSGFQVFGVCESTDEVVDIEISDTGHGILPELLPRIFDPFFTTKEVGKGSGLGLFIVFEIVEEHGGCIAVRSEIAKGTTFLIRLPLTGTKEATSP